MAKKKPEKITVLVSDTFTTLYAALMILLLAFFILLNSMATVDEDHLKEALGSLLGSFGVLPGGLQVFIGEIFIPPGAPMKAVEEETIPLSVEIPTAIRRIRSEGLPQEEIVLDENVTLSGRKGDLVLTLSDRVLFEAGSSELNPRCTQLLDEIAVEFELMENLIEVEGHADDRMDPGGRFASGWDLSARRAIAVLRYFTEQCKLPEWRLSAVALGEHHPRASNETEEGRAKNRRVSLVIKAMETVETPF